MVQDIQIDVRRGHAAFVRPCKRSRDAHPEHPATDSNAGALDGYQSTKMLKKQGKYAGQQEIYPKGIQPDARPICATYVRQFTVGAINPGRKHQRAVEGYVEEAFKCIPNLEVVDVYRLTE